MSILLDPIILNNGNTFSINYFFPIRHVLSHLYQYWLYRPVRCAQMCAKIKDLCTVYWSTCTQSPQRHLLNKSLTSFVTTCLEPSKLSFEIYFTLIFFSKIIFWQLALAFVCLCSIIFNQNIMLCSYTIVWELFSGTALLFNELVLIQSLVNAISMNYLIDFLSLYGNPFHSKYRLIIHFKRWPNYTAKV